MNNLISIFISVILAIFVPNIITEISDKRLCIDDNCSEKISIGKTLRKYDSHDEHILSFLPNQDVTVYSYGAGSVPDLIGVEINGKRGYINKKDLKETELIKKPKKTLDTESNDISADRTKFPYEIIDGTKIPLMEEEQTTTTAAKIEDSGKVDDDKNENVEEEEEEDNDEDDVEIDGEDEENSLDDSNNITEQPNAPNVTTENGHISSINSSETTVEFVKAKNNEDGGLNEDKFNIEHVTQQIENNSKPEIPSATEGPSTTNESVTQIPYSIEILPIVQLSSSNEDFVTPNPVSEELKENNEKKKVTSEEEELRESNEKEKSRISDEGENKLGDSNKTEELGKSDKEEVKKNEKEVELVNTEDNLESNKDDLTQTNEEKEDADGSKEPPVLLKDSGIKEEIQKEPSNGDSIFGNILPIFKTTTSNIIEDENVEIENKLPQLPVIKEKEEDPVNVPNLLPEETPNENLVEEAAKLINNDTIITEESNTSIAEDNVESISVNPIAEEQQQKEEEYIDKHEDKLVEKEEEIGTGAPEIETENYMVEEKEKVGDGFLSTVLSYFQFRNDDKTKEENRDDSSNFDEIDDNVIEYEDFPIIDNIEPNPPSSTPTTTSVITELLFAFLMEIPTWQQSDNRMALYLITTALSILLLLIIGFIMDQCRREIPLVGRINQLEKQLMATRKENQLLEEELLGKSNDFEQMKTVESKRITNEELDELKQQLIESNNEKIDLEEQIQLLEKELDNSTEVGIELNKIIAEMLNSSSDNNAILKTNVEEMQKKLLEQQDSINATNELIKAKKEENDELKMQLVNSNKKIKELQMEVDQMVEKILQIELDQNDQHEKWEQNVQQLETKVKESEINEQALKAQIQMLHQQNLDLKTMSEIKIKEYNLLKENLNQIELIRNNEGALNSLLEVSEVKAKLEHLIDENQKYSQQLSTESEKNSIYTKTIEKLNQSIREINDKYDKTDKEKVEIKTKLEVLNNYFKEKEEQMQKQISKYETLWVAKEGEASTTSERFKYMQEELQHCKKQNDDLKQEIINQEVELKSQISMLENKASESWLTNRQIERKLEEAKQEAAQLRNILTLRERNADGNNNNNNNGQLRIQSSPYQNGGDLFNPISPQPPLQYSASTHSPPPPPPLSAAASAAGSGTLFYPGSSNIAGSGDTRTKSPSNNILIPPPLPPFLPPPTSAGVGAGMPPPPPPPFIPFPLLDGMIPPPLPSTATAIGDMASLPSAFMPPPLPPQSGIYPDHRLPPLGRLSSPPPRGINSSGGRYSPESTIYSEYDPYDRRSRSSDDDDDDDIESGEWKQWTNDDREWEQNSRKHSNNSHYNKRSTISNSSRNNGRNVKSIHHSSGSENGSIEKSRNKSSYLKKV